jgi:predicted NBD/HSP70 family sugar kinase
MRTTGDQQLLKRINRSVLLRLMRAQPGLSRARLAQQSGLTKSTVSALVRELLDEHWLNEASAPVAADGMGRPSTPLRLNEDVRVLIGVEIAVEFLRIVCVSLTGVVISKAEVPLESTQPDRVCKQTTRMVHGLCQQLQSSRLVLSGVGVCLPGAINDDSGIVRFAPNLGWRGVKFLDMISRAFADAGVPSTSIHLQNDADAASLSEYEFATGEGEDPLIFINCDVGVGAGIVLNDRLFTGAVGTAGEIGHTIMQIEGPLCSCGRRGCAETFIGSRALSTDARIERAGQYLGVLVQNLDVMFNPRTIVLGGKSCVNNPDLIGNAIQTLSGYAQRAGVPVPTVRSARYGLLAAAVGAAALVLHRFLRPIPVGTPVMIASGTVEPAPDSNKQKKVTRHVPASDQANGVSDVSWH